MLYRGKKSTKVGTDLTEIQDKISLVLKGLRLIKEIFKHPSREGKRPNKRCCAGGRKKICWE